MVLGIILVYYASYVGNGELNLTLDYFYSIDVCFICDLSSIIGIVGMNHGVNNL